jgi:hypothetical protein
VKVQKLYEQGLLDLDKDPVIRLRVLERLEQLAQRAALEMEDLNKDNYISIMKELDTFLAEKGYPQFSEEERLKKAITFFEKASQEDFKKHLGRYIEVRKALWEQIMD